MVRTLVVDDTEETQIVLAQLIHLAGGQVVGQASTTEEALSWLATHAVDLVVTDFQMPGLPGDILAQQVRRRWPETRVALVSVRDDTELTERARVAEVDWLLSKPVTLETVEGLIRGSFRHASRVGSSTASGDPEVRDS